MTSNDEFKRLQPLLGLLVALRRQIPGITLLWPWPAAPDARTKTSYFDLVRAALVYFLFQYLEQNLIIRIGKSTPG